MTFKSDKFSWDTGDVTIAKKKATKAVKKELITDPLKGKPVINLFIGKHIVLNEGVIRSEEYFKGVIKKIKETLDGINYDYESEILKFGQVSNADKRKSGHTFSINEHLRGLILAMLSSHRPWGPIAENINKINKIFFNFDKNSIINTDKNLFVKKLSEIKCGNIAITNQMNSLNYNIEIMDKIEKEYGSVDNFIISDDFNNIAKKLSKPGKYKFKQIDYPLSLEYLRNVGISAIKPDVHILRIIGPERLHLCTKKPSEREAVNILSKLSKELNMNLTYIDNLIWIFCAMDYGNICNEKPKCNICHLKGLCNY